MMTVGCISFSMNGRATDRISPAFFFIFFFFKGQINEQTKKKKKIQRKATNDVDRGGAITDLLILGPRELNHALGRWVGHVNLSEDGISIVGQHDATHGIKQHLEHGLGSKTSANQVRHHPGSGDVAQLGLAAVDTLGVLLWERGEKMDEKNG